MTLSSQQTKIVYEPDGTAAVFAVPFPVYDAADIECVSVDGSLEIVFTSGFSVSGMAAGNVAVTFAAPPPAGTKLVIRRATRRVQESDYPTAGRFPAKTLEHDLDRVTAMIQEVDEVLGRAVKVDASQAAAPSAREFLDEFNAARDEAQSFRDEACDCAGQATDMLERGITAAERAESLIGQATEAVIAEGQNQVNIVRSEGDAAAQRASAEADRSKSEADRATQLAEDLANVSNFGTATRTRQGVVRIGDGIAVDDEGTISVRFPTVVSTPAVSFPELVGIGYQYEAVMSAESGAPGAAVEYFEVYVDDALPVQVPAANNQAAYMVTPSGVSGTVGRLVVIAFDTLENFSLASTTTFVKSTVTVHAPAIISPAPGAVGIALTPTVQIQQASISGVIASPDQTHIQIATDAAFTDMVAERPPELGYATLYAVPQLGITTTYSIRARHHYPVYGWSAWGMASAFTTMSASVSVPVITSPADNAVDFFTNGPMTFDQPVVAGQTHQYMQIQIASDLNFSTIVYDTDSIAPALSHVFSPALAKNTNYYARARNYGTLTGWTAWSAVVSLTTAAVAVGEVITINSTQNYTIPVGGVWKLEAAGGGGNNCSASCGAFSCPYPDFDNYPVTTWCGGCSCAGYGGTGGYAAVTSSLDKQTIIPLTVGGVAGTSSVGAYVSATGGGNASCSTSMSCSSCSWPPYNMTFGVQSGTATCADCYCYNGGAGTGGGGGAAAGNAGWLKLTFMGAA